MAGERELDEVLVRNEEAGIWYLPIKRQTANPTDLLGSQKMKQLLGPAARAVRLRRAGLGAAAGRHRHQGRLAVRRQGAVRDAVGPDQPDTAVNALAHMREARGHVAGVVLTQVDVRKHAQYGYGDVGQYYGKYQKYYVN